MQDWNVVITVREGGFKRVFRILEEFGPISRTGYFNVLAMRANNIEAMMEHLRERIEGKPEVLSFLARVIPLTQTFSFDTPEEFEEKAKEIVLSWVPDLGGKGFCVRMHRRGFKGRLSSWDEERMLDEALLEYLEKAGTPGHVTFGSPDAIIAVETLGNWAGLSIWSREELERYPFLRFEGSTKSEAKQADDGAAQVQE
jgi:tRNA(Ser,Leu) C12 N-acetylase TAN1